MSTLHILWDEAHIWGLLAVRAVRAFGVPHRIVSARQIAEGLLQREQPAMLMVPGGNARGKSLALGEKGRAAIGQYVGEGGHYLGFCGGAGLALTWDSTGEPGQRPAQGKNAAASGLGLCPWERGKFDDRLQHFMSGHLHSRLAEKNDLPSHAARLLPPDLGPSPEASCPEGHPLLPVWWPGHFSARENLGVSVLAAYEKPGPDFWLTDLPINAIPEEIFTAWKEKYGFSPRPTFLEGQPALVTCAHGKGSCTLSYSHLETPASPQANAWLAYLLEELAGLSPCTRLVPPWDEEDLAWEDSDLATIEDDIETVVSCGLEHGLLFRRNDWLLGWRTGIPGSNINNLHSLVRVMRRTPPTDEARALFAAKVQTLRPLAARFRQEGVEYLLTERLAQTLTKTMPDLLPPSLLKKQRAALFGPPMLAGGVYLDLLEALDGVVCAQLS